jgi:hypothetical protein
VLHEFAGVGVGGDERLDGELGEGDVVSTAEAGDGAVEAQVAGRVGQLKRLQQLGRRGFVVVVQRGSDTRIAAHFFEELRKAAVAGEVR